MSDVTITKDRVIYHKYLLREPAPTITDIFDQVYRYLEVVPNPSALYLYEDQMDWLAERRYNKRSRFQGRVQKLHEDLNYRNIPIKVIPRPTPGAGADA